MIPMGERVGSFRYLRAGDRWEWSDAVAQIHGYRAGQVQPSTPLVMSHKHPEDAEHVRRLIEAMTREGRPFSSRHRIVDTRGRIHPVAVIGERLIDDMGNVIGSQGLYVDLSDVDDAGMVEDAIADFTEHRAIIEQAKGALMLTYGISADRAFDILVWRSQETNTRLRTLATQLLHDLTSELQVPAGIRERADHLLLTAHKRVRPPLSRRGSRSDAC
ncbi:PAS and ANTAR domain-containing protein [Mycobacterium sp. 3519A]|uniref:PAS and ANTAR domain-containing protein n=1 Tax=Mycobacterium sp. 3519A TaxID=2057184 RepID=UPI000C7BF78E|nr:PAS and ANTAR domain-containing protein [Mycobacterium sp. 3519A]